MGWKRRSTRTLARLFEVWFWRHRWKSMLGFVERLVPNDNFRIYMCSCGGLIHVRLANRRVTEINVIRPCPAASAARWLFEHDAPVPRAIVVR